jgi:hypothetical protein
MIMSPVAAPSPAYGPMVAGLARAGARGAERQAVHLISGPPLADCVRDGRCAVCRALARQGGFRPPILCAGVTAYKGIKETEARPGESIGRSFLPYRPSVTACEEDPLRTCRTSIGRSRLHPARH